MPGGNFQTIWRHERGEVYPGPHYQRAYCLLYQADEADLGFRLPLPHEQQPDTAAPASGVGDDDEVRRRDFLRAALVGGAAVAMVPAMERVRSALITYAPQLDIPSLSLGKAEMATVEAHRLYQAAEYEVAAKLLPAVVRDVEALAEDTDAPPPQRGRVQRVPAVA